MGKGEVMFEVGKKYKYTQGAIGIWECVKENENSFLLIRTQPNEVGNFVPWVLPKGNIQKLYWDEYKEPQKIKFYITIFRDKYSKIIYPGASTYAGKIKLSNLEPIDWVEVEYTEKVNNAE